MFLNFKQRKRFKNRVKFNKINNYLFFVYRYIKLELINIKRAYKK